LAMIDAIGCGGRRVGSGARGFRVGKVSDANLDRVKLSVVGWRNETKIVFVTDELRDFREDCGEILGGFGEIGAAAIGFCNGS